MENSTILNQIKNAFSIEENDTAQDKVFLDIIGRVKAAMLLYLAEEEVPKALEWVLVEASIQRAGLLGSEAYTSETIEGQSISYKKDPLQDYYSYLDSWAVQNKTGGHKSNKVRFF